ncbi:MAG: hypothetical protein GX650_08330 [Clostridiales bacterium]|nr:hypothetical protein [Clostridiales bacterium]
MARFNTEGLQPLLEDMRRLDQLSGPTADKMLLAGAEEVKQAWKQEAARRRFRDTRAMINSIGFPRAVTRASDIASIDIYPQGEDTKGRKRGVRNAEKAFILHYGTDASGARTSRKDKKMGGKGIPRTLWVDAADKAAGPRVIAVYTRIWDEFLKGR